jgi:hypothetical protein
MPLSTTTGEGTVVVWLLCAPIHASTGRERWRAGAPHDPMVRMGEAAVRGTSLPLLHQHTMSIEMVT